MIALRTAWRLFAGMTWCRLFGHHWTARGAATPGDYDVRWYSCMNCPSQAGP
jgi:hypothetical protein